MSHGEEIFDLGEDVTSEPTFESALRGYDKRQVDRYVARAEGEIAALAADREQAYAQLQAMAGQLEQVQGELGQARRRVGVSGQVSFRHLGPRVEQILTLAEEQAEAIRSGASNEVSKLRAEEIGRASCRERV